MATHTWSGCAAIALIVASTLTFAQPGARPSGHWEGTIQVPGQELKVEIDLAETGGKWQGTISIPAQGMKGFPLANIAVEAEAVSFAMKGIPGDPQFKGTLSKDGKGLSGTFTQGGGSLPFTLTRTGGAKFEPAPKSTAITKELEGSWEGTLDVEGTKLRLVLKLANQADGGATGTLVSLDQGNVEIPVGSVIQDGTKLKVLVPTVMGTYEGELKEGQLTGTWTQGPGSRPLTFTRAN